MTLKKLFVFLVSASHPWYYGVLAAESRGSADVAAFHPSGNPLTALAAPTRPNNALFLGRVNAHRKANGQQSLIGDIRLDAAAQQQCSNLRSGNNLAHSQRGGQSPGGHLDRFGYRWNMVAENIFSEVRQSNTGGVRAFESWKNNAAANFNMVNPPYTSFGVALCQSQSVTYWVAVFAKGDLDPSKQYAESTGNANNLAQEQRNSARKSSYRHPSSTILTTGILTLACLFFTIA